ncbi:unnamed protein product [Lota lota]
MLSSVRTLQSPESPDSELISSVALRCAPQHVRQLYDGDPSEIRCPGTRLGSGAGRSRQGMDGVGRPQRSKVSGVSELRLPPPRAGDTQPARHLSFSWTAEVQGPLCEEEVVKEHRQHHHRPL